MVVEKTKIEAATNAFKLCCQTKSSSKMQVFLFYVRDSVELDNWIKAIKDGSEKARKD